MEKKDLMQTFNEISEDFSRTRSEPWDEVVEFVEHRPRGGVGLDLGCGNGRHLSLLNGFGLVVGVDFSADLIKKGVESGVDACFVQGDICEIPIMDDVVDLCLYIAALHHLPSHEERLQSLVEVDRVMASGGEVLLSVWAIEHPRFDGIRDEIRENNGDIIVPWIDSEMGDSHERYYHIYEMDEFKGLLSESPMDVSEFYESNGNYFCVLAT